MPSRVPVVLVFLALTLPVQGQTPPRQPTFGTGTTGVVVDVVVRDRKGNPVTDLRKEDFELLEDGVRQEIADLRLVAPSSATGRAKSASTARPAGATDSAQQSPPSVQTPAFVALVFDRLTPEARALAHKGALAYLDSARPDDFAGVFLIDLHLQTLLTYTNDRAKLRTAIDEAGSRATTTFSRAAGRVGPTTYGDRHPARSPTASAEEHGPPDPQTAEIFRKAPDDTRDPGLAIIKMAERMERSYEAMIREEQGYATAHGLLAVVDSLGTLPGRKTVVFFAEGLAIPPAVQMRFDSVVVNANRANVSVYTVDAAGLRVQSSGAEATRQIREIGAMGLGDRGRSGKWTSDLELNEDILKQDPSASLGILADRTGGFLINNTNDLARGVQQIDADRRFHYLLTYTPMNEQFDGEWRNVTVRVPSRRVEVRARSGYLAVKALGAIPFLAHEGPAIAALDRNPRPTNVPVTARAFVFPAGGEARLAVLASTPVSSITFASDEKNFRTDFTILARILDARGEVVRKASEPYRLSGPLSDKAQAQKGEVLFFRQPTLPPGSYTLEAAVHDALGEKAGVASQSFEVPDPKSSAVSSLMVVSRGERVSEPQKDNPLYVGDVLVYPNLGKPVSKTDGAITLFLTFVPVAGRTPSAELELLREGTALAKVPLTFDAPVEGRIQQLWRVPTENLAPGDYTFKVTVSDGQEREVREMAVRVVD